MHKAHVYRISIMLLHLDWLIHTSIITALHITHIAGTPLRPNASCVGVTASCMQFVSNANGISMFLPYCIEIAQFLLISSIRASHARNTFYGLAVPRCHRPFAVTSRAALHIRSFHCRCLSSTE